MTFITATAASQTRQHPRLEKLKSLAAARLRLPEILPARTEGWIV